MCPFCKATRKRTIKKGSFAKKSGKKHRMRRYFCKDCRRHFSDATGSRTFRQKKAHLNFRLFDLFSMGVSQRKIAEYKGISRSTVARKLILLGAQCRKVNRKPMKMTSDTVVFDEMETFEHTKCKPLSIALAVEQGSRKIISVKVSKMPAKGRLAAISQKKYGYRQDCRKDGLVKMLRDIEAKTNGIIVFKSDQSPRYPSLVKSVFPHAKHVAYKGRRACVVGQGELKVGGWDPIFSLNHTCAMYRDNIKRLSRRSWCTTKNPDRLQDLLDIYVTYHNGRVSGRRRLVRF